MSGTKKRSAEQKLMSGTKTVEQKLVGRIKKRSAEQKLVSGTKMAEQKWRNKNGRTKIIDYSESPKQKLVGTVQVQKGQQNKNWWALSTIG